MLPGERAWDSLVVSAAGHVAQARFVGEAVSRAAAADDIAFEQLLLELGVIPDRTGEALGTASEIAGVLLDTYWVQVTRVAGELMMRVVAKGTMRGRFDGTEVARLLEGTGRAVPAA